MKVAARAEPAEAAVHLRAGGVLQPRFPAALRREPAALRRAAQLAVERLDVRADGLGCATKKALS